jgi:hypothetical protein
MYIIINEHGGDSRVLILKLLSMFVYIIINKL